MCIINCCICTFVYPYIYILYFLYMFYSKICICWETGIPLSICVKCYKYSFCFHLRKTHNLDDQLKFCNFPKNKKQINIYVVILHYWIFKNVCIRNCFDLFNCKLQLKVNLSKNKSGRLADSHKIALAVTLNTFQKIKYSNTNSFSNRLWKFYKNPNDSTGKYIYLHTHVYERDTYYMYMYMCM